MEGEEVQKVICSDRGRGSYVGHSPFLSSLARQPLPYALRLHITPRLRNSRNAEGRGWRARLIFERLVLSSV